MEGFCHVESWVFDLDNTLYDAESHVFDMVTARMTRFVSEHLKINEETATQIRRRMRQEYGTTLRGMMLEHGIDPNIFLDYVHDIDMSVVAPCPVIKKHLALLPGKRVVFTNAPRRFAEAMLEKLEIAAHFHGLFTIEDADYWPKPHARAFQDFFDHHSIDPAKSCMFEDMEENLKTAHDLGMTTVWLHGRNAVKKRAHIHHTHEKLADWLLKKG